MKKVSKNKVQQVFISHLFQEGQVQIVLPNDMILEVGITQENRYGDLEKNPEYCWVIASQNGRSVSIDEYNLGLRYKNQKDRMVCEHSSTSHTGEDIKILDVI